jgi:hypothetical protein
MASVIPHRYPNMEIAAPTRRSVRPHGPKTRPAASASGVGAVGSSAPSTPWATTCSPT